MDTNYNIAINNKFKTNCLVVRYLLEATQENMTKANLLSLYLIYSNNIHPSHKEAIEYLEKLYGCRFDIHVSIKGTKIVFDYYINFVSSKFILNNNNYLSDIIETFLTYIFNPYVVDNTFDKKTFELKHYELKQRIISIYDDKLSLANDEFYTHFGSEYPLEIKDTGDLVSLNSIDNDTLFEFYKSLIQATPLICAEVNKEDYDLVISELEHKIKYDLFNVENIYYNIEYNYKEEVIEPHASAQAKLVIGYVYDNVVNNINYYKLLVFNSIFGMSSNSLLFKKVREESNLCYSINSRYDQFSNTIVINAGIKKDDYLEAVNLISSIFNSLVNGEFDSDIINESKIVLKDILMKTSDNQNTLINYKINRIMQKLSTELDNDIELINKINKQDIIDVAKGLHLKTIYMLGGDKDE